MIYLGLGSNLGDRRHYLAEAISQLKTHGFKVLRQSPVVESPALLKADALAEWNRPYLNMVVCGETEHRPQDILSIAKKIERSLGRELDTNRWAPRTIDIDILLWHDEKISTPELTVPHAELYKRAFVITPLTHLAPHLVIPGIELTPLQISQNIAPIPLWMGIVNVSPDSFSDGGENEKIDALGAKLESWIEAGVQILDFGAESTRPNAEPISEALEWTRLEPIFKLLKMLRKRHTLMPIVSVDTRHYSIARLALENGADWINDVSGLADKEMQALAREAAAEVVAMHSLTVPVNPKETLKLKTSAAQQLITWLNEKAISWESAGLDLGRIIFDPGIGFGKTALQNIALIKATANLRGHGFRLLVGHSRKSFMNHFSDDDFSKRDVETLGLSLAMCEQGVDIIRVHDPLRHMRAYRAWVHARV